MLNVSQAAVCHLEMCANKGGIVHRGAEVTVKAIKEDKEAQNVLNSLEEIAKAC